jgi:hypothetical protein
MMQPAEMLIMQPADMLDNNTDEDTQEADFVYLQQILTPQLPSLN